MSAHQRAHRREAGRGHGEVAERVARAGVDAERHDEAAGRAALQELERHRRASRGTSDRRIPAASGKLRLAPAPAPVPVSSERVTGEVGEGAGRVGVQRGVGDVGALVEDLLRAVAVVDVDVEDRDGRRQPPAPLVGDDGGVVEEAEAADHRWCRRGGPAAGRARRRSPRRPRRRRAPRAPRRPLRAPPGTCLRRAASSCRSTSSRGGRAATPSARRAAAGPPRCRRGRSCRG